MKITKVVAKKADLGNKEIALMDYALKSIWNDISKLLIFSTIAIFVGKFNLYCLLY